MTFRLLDTLPEADGSAMRAISFIGKRDAAQCTGKLFGGPVECHADATPNATPGVAFFVLGALVQWPHAPRIGLGQLGPLDGRNRVSARLPGLVHARRHGRTRAHRRNRRGPYEPDDARFHLREGAPV